MVAGSRTFAELIGGPRVAVKSEGLAAVIGNELPAELFDSQEEIAEAVVALCDCSSDVTGRVGR